MENPFVLEPYVCKELFCDREEELKRLMSFCRSGVNTTLVADRRLGKTGLIWRFFDEIKRKKLPHRPIYVDIYATQNLSGFVKCFAEAILAQYPEHTTFGKRFFNFIKGFRPLLSFDPITGSPQIQIAYQLAEQKESSLISIFNFLERQQIPIIIAIDEFQQIREYPETNVEAILRTHIQTLKNIRFIFSGSKKHVMMDMFSNAKKPFYASTQFYKIEAIQKEKYAEFITNLFQKNNRIINSEALDFILEWTKQHTYYTQFLCNRVFESGARKITLDVVKQCCKQVFLLNEASFFQYRSLLTDNQWNFLIAVAKKNTVYKPTANNFLVKYNIGTPANARRIVSALVEKELLCEHYSLEGKYYTVYDVFLSRWLENEL
jgi:hypothetical protein